MNPEDLDELKSVAHKNTVEDLLSSIELKAEKDPERAEQCEFFKSTLPAKFLIFGFFSDFGGNPRVE